MASMMDCGKIDPNLKFNICEATAGGDDDEAVVDGDYGEEGKDRVQ